ncbi:MAG: NtaA/DmoA family FMN-dependent monooxygenase [Pseudomonadota bacterium]
MSIAKRLKIGMSLAPTWLNGDAWRRPDSDVERLFDCDFYVDVAKRAEASKLDFVFRPDTQFLNVEVLESSPGFSSLDPTILLAAIARHTSHIGLLSTVSTTFFSPYIAARQLLSLHWLSKGRAGWNIVTALDGNENFGLTSMPSSQERYSRAAEFTDVVRRLWASFPHDALQVGRHSGRYADASRICPIDHEGDHFSVRGPLNLPCYPGASIPLIQAGASPTGRDFAAAIASASFASTPDMDAAIELRRDLRHRAESHGRAGDDIRLMPGLSLYLAPCRKEAQDLFNETNARIGDARRIASVKQMIGLDLGDWPRDRRISASDLPEALANVRSRTHSELLRRLIVREEPTVAELLGRPEVIGSAHWQIIGTVDDAAAEIAAWTSAGAIDGFIAVPGGSTASMALTLDELVPRLAEDGLFRSDYGGATFAGHLNE